MPEYSLQAARKSSEGQRGSRVVREAISLGLYDALRSRYDTRVTGMLVQVEVGRGGGGR